jgi:hypothetical protein
MSRQPDHSSSVARPVLPTKPSSGLAASAAGGSVVAKRIKAIGSGWQAAWVEPASAFDQHRFNVKRNATSPVSHSSRHSHRP